MGTSAANEPLDSFISAYMIYELLIVFSYFFMSSPLEMVAFTTSRIYLVIDVIDITSIDKKYVITLLKNLNLYAK